MRDDGCLARFPEKIIAANYSGTSAVDTESRTIGSELKTLVVLGNVN